ncbi:unnamed protein product [Calicophoron daubneyi]|uniref:Myosin motor domain-containing protein n=1 Tax=Calicophoron daubneyi TaxID=300641 RepID=A0AAV2TQ18_CALDB
MITMQCQTNDVLHLPKLDDTSVLSLLRQRYEANEIYTWVGDDILVSLNPNRTIPGLYTQSEQDTIAKLGDLHSRSHLYSMAEQCLRRAANGLKPNQTMIISGLSGSGKTEAAKHILQYLVCRSRHKRHKHTGFDENRIESVLLQSSPVLEAFGNARTLCNNNSSRFGKYVSLQYSENQILIGATLEAYLLEKPRAVFDNASLFSSFNIFRLFLSYLSETDAKTMGLEELVVQAKTYGNSLGVFHPSTSSNMLTWPDVLDSLTFLGLSTSDLDGLRRLLASLILLNMTRFIPADAESNGSPVNSRVSHTMSSDSIRTPNENVLHSHSCDVAQIHPEDVKKVVLAGQLLGLPADDVDQYFPQHLITRRVQAGGAPNLFRSRRMTEYTTACTLSQAREQRDCLVKALYNSLFQYLVNTINVHLRSASADGCTHELGILDFFGFERFIDNGFEQFCINYANERLHQVFMRVAVKGVYDELVSEGLNPREYKGSSGSSGRNSEACFISSCECDNESVLESMRTCAALLNEVCLLNRIYERDTRRVGGLSDQLDPREADWIRRVQLQPLEDIVVCGTANKGHLNSPAPVQRRSSSKKSLRPITHHPSVSVPPARYRSGNCFTVAHYAGQVTYSAGEFVSKNLDRLPAHLLHWLATSCMFDDGEDKENSELASTPVRSTLNENPHSSEYTNEGLLCSVVRHAASPQPTLRVQNSPLCSPTHTLRPANSNRMSSSRTSASRTQFAKIRPLFDSPLSPTITSSPKSLPRVSTVFGHFKSSLDSLLTRLSTHQISFIRCLQPNRVRLLKSPRSSATCVDADGRRSGLGVPAPSVNSTCQADWDGYLKDQLVTGGLLASVRVLRSTYPARYVYHEFIGKYRIFQRLTPVLHLGTGVRIPPSTADSSGSSPLRSPASSFSSFVEESRHGSLSVDDQKHLAKLLLILGLNLYPVPDEFTSIAADKKRLSSLYANQFGRTRVHLTRSQVTHLDRLSKLMFSSAANTVKRFFRHCHRRHLAASSIQRWWRKQQQLREFNHLSITEVVENPQPNNDYLKSPSSKVVVASEPEVPDQSSDVCLAPVPADFPTLCPHLVSRHKIVDLDWHLTHNSHYWNVARSQQLHCLIPFVRKRWSAIIAPPDSSKGLTGLLC